ncbi:thiosulfate oxidation carrier protein SoxY [Albimonas sp. CAU 1670]|uniref:thiosulfate oxidation carrier protein SoxY n=1 Tax=Albimonas sp. CAU 1670 TaxID=3032599 RepID=UPI0023DBB1F0|nr:thiosulfate oxidation carrier protein SoxY [Albimonas sp. CAU 1670]MDF2231773.1 thiosulfate oxidation carrier protein SoxY [Albimonas sp. CAU 1670]
MKITRRAILAFGAGGLAAAAMPFRLMAKTLDEAMSAFTGGASTGEGRLTLTAPEIAENGNTVPVTVSAPGAVEIAIWAAGNPSPDVATFKFGPAAGSQTASTRIRLAKTQDVVAVAKMADGSFVKAQATVKVTIGGCGG